MHNPNIDNPSEQYVTPAFSRTVWILSCYLSLGGKLFFQFQCRRKYDIY